MIPTCSPVQVQSQYQVILARKGQYHLCLTFLKELALDRMRVSARRYSLTFSSDRSIPMHLNSKRKIQLLPRALSKMALSSTCRSRQYCVQSWAPSFEMTQAMGALNYSFRALTIILPVNGLHYGGAA